ncbi:Plasmodium exported protein (PHIST), unknown function [Plasmodium relictum]|uniref:Plasmodium RESA N-terminal domain-containing protein n=1 Tax=Plasmodium relictum TaxID=85471 RepID=A0A1J1GK68_PLARL|nr:Plasmodium exported protein (PHIST), unknown function [Plasmodium relictum]CRG84717.1 Plasmodium exported protein (PHIST), unknown function [Plasmodium relictum]
MESCSTCLLGKKGYIFKRGSYQNYILSKPFTIYFLSLFIFFLQDKLKPQNNITSEFQLKCNISRRLAESEGNINDQNLGETISHLELMSIWNNDEVFEERKLNDTLMNLLEHLHKEAPTYNIDEHGKNELWSSILRDVNKCVAILKHNISTRLNDLVISGSCTREESKKFLDFAAHLWGNLRYTTEREFWNRLNRSRRSNSGLFS